MASAYGCGSAPVLHRLPLSSQACVMPRTVHRAGPAPTRLEQARRRAVPGSRATLRSVTRPRASAPGIPRLLLPLAATAALLIAGCGSAQGTSAPSASAGPDSSRRVSGEPASTDPGVARSSQSGRSRSATPSDPPPSPETSPSATPDRPPTAPGPRRTGRSTDPSRRPSIGPSTARSCPSGWFVEAGQYRLAGGGRLAIAYRGPGGARFSLDEGAWCTDGSGCVPAGTDLGTTAFGDRTGTLVATDDGEFAIVVDAGLVDQLGADRRRPRRGHRPHLRGRPHRRRRLTEPTRVRLADFELERYFARWEFAADWLLCALGRPGLPDGRAAGPRRRRDARPLGRPTPRLHRVDRPPAAPPRDRVALRDDRARTRS